METFIGQIHQVRFYSNETFFIVASVTTEEQERDILMTGYMPDYSEHKTYRFEGEFIEHPRYGKQFKIEKYEEVMATDKAAIIRYLASPLFKGVGMTLASCIVDTLGDDALNVIIEHPDALDRVRGMSEERKNHILEVLQNKDESQAALRFLMENGLTLKLASKVIAVYPKNALEVVQENPYTLVETVEGIGFKTADDLAMHMEIAQNHPYRLDACLVYTIKQMCMNQGCTYVSLEPLKKQMLKAMPFLSEAEALAVLERQVDSGTIILEDERYYPSTLYEAEQNIASTLRRYINGVEELEFDFDDVEDQLVKLEEKWNIAYDESQKEAIYAFMENDILLLTGGPGTGKTTIVRAMLALYKKLFPTRKIALVAPTGRAAKRLSEACETPAMTIHRLLKWDISTGIFNMDKEHPIEADLLVIDEFSMVDTYLFSQLLNACGLVSKILMIGDEAQLPSIAPGQVLFDLIRSQQIECVSLKHIFRQNAKSGIVQISHALRNGEYQDDHLFEVYQDIRFMPCRDQDVVRFVCKIAAKALKEGYDLYDFQVLAPMYQGVAGIDAINEALQKILNPPSEDKREVRIYQHVFREGDKVLQLKNRPDDNVFNGDIGEIIEIEKKDGVHYTQDRLIVDFEGDIVEYTSQDFGQLTLAYCMSIHKAQGSEFKIVVMPIVRSHLRMLRKNLIYTGMTRAKQALFLLGDHEVFHSGIGRDEARRQTTLTQKMQGESSLSVYDFMD